MPSCCRAPGCRRRIKDTSEARVCRAHMHSRWCECSQCKGRRPSVKEGATVSSPPNMTGFEGLPISDVPSELIDPAACRRLWCAVLKNHWDTALVPDRSGQAREGADTSQRWMGGRDFRLTCAMIGLDDELVLKEFRAQLDASQVAV